MKPRIVIEAKIILQVREQDVNLLLKALQQYSAENEDEVRNRTYLLDVLEYLAIPAEQQKLYGKLLVYTRKKVAVYDIEAVNQQESEKQAVEQYKKDKDTWLDPRLVETVDEYEAEDTQYPQFLY